MRVSFNFIRVSIVYFLIGALWMGLGDGLRIPHPTSEFASMIYDLGLVHVMVLGWASFAIMGAIYYVVPRAAERELHSERLGTVHFWVTNITFPIAVLLLVWGSFVADSLVAKGLTEEQVLGDPTFLPFFLIYLIVVIIGYAAQFIFAYNIYKTMSTRA